MVQPDIRLAKSARALAPNLLAFCLCTACFDPKPPETAGTDGSEESSGSAEDDGSEVDSKGESTEGGDPTTATSSSDDEGTSETGSTSSASATSTPTETADPTTGITSTTSATSTTDVTDSAETSDTTNEVLTDTGGADTSEDSSSNVDFEPCPSTGPCSILPLGDSITFGLVYAGGYRVELFRRALEEGHEITFIGTQAPNGPAEVEGVPFPRNHEGVNGETIQQIADRVPAPALNEVPHIILVHAGMNDMYDSGPGAPDRLAALLDELIEQAPDALIVVSSIIPFPLASDAVAVYNGTIPPLVDERAAAGAHVIFVDQYTGFPESELADGVHPGEPGYARMGGVWYDAISSYLR